MEGHNTRRILLWISVAELFKKNSQHAVSSFFFGVCVCILLSFDILLKHVMEDEH